MMAASCRNLTLSSSVVFGFSVFTAISIVQPENFHIPLHTWPNCPDPSFSNNLISEFFFCNYHSLTQVRHNNQFTERYALSLCVWATNPPTHRSLYEHSTWLQFPWYCAWVKAYETNHSEYEWKMSARNVSKLLVTHTNRKRTIKHVLMSTLTSMFDHQHDIIPWKP